MLAIIETHPVQYHAPMYSLLTQEYKIPLRVIYGSDYSVSGAVDPQFGVRVAWDTDLLAGYPSMFLTRGAPQRKGNALHVSSRGLWDAICETEPRAIMLLGYSPRFYQSAIAVASRARKPVLFRGEVNDEAGRRGRAKAAVRRLFLRALYRRVDRLLYIGSRAREHYLRMGVPTERLVFSPYAADHRPHESYLSDTGRAEARRTLGVSADKTILLYCGKLYAAKGILVLAEALRQLPREVRERLHLLIAGDGELREPFESACKAYSEMTATFLGFKNQTELGQIYAAADLLVLPSFSETWGLVVNESLLHGIPCVVTNRVGCADDLVIPGKTGEICDARSAESLAAAITRALLLVGDPTVAANCRSIAGEFSMHRAAQGVRDAYLSVT